jgi:hypothetical protein
VTLQTDAGAVVTRAPDVCGNYLGFYAQLCAHLSGHEDQPAVTPTQVYQAMQLLTQGAQSALQGETLAVAGRPDGESAVARR